MPALGLGLSVSLGARLAPLPLPAASWSADSGVTTVTVSNVITASTNCGGYPTGAPTLNESTDGAPAQHYASYGTSGGFQPGPYRMTCVGVGSGRDWIQLQCNAAGAIYGFFDLTNGTTGNHTADATLSITGPVAGKYSAVLDTNAFLGAVAASYFKTASANGTLSYQGDGRHAFDIDNAAPSCVSQNFVSAWVDTVVGYSMANAVAATRPFAQTAAGGPGVQIFSGKASILQTTDTAKTIACATAGLLALISGMPSHTWIWRGSSLAAPAAAVPLFGITGAGTYAVGLDTARKPYATIGATTITAAAARDATDVFTAFVWNAATGEGSLYTITTAGVVTEQCPPTAMAVGVVTPTAIVFTERSSATMLRRLYASALSTNQLSRICSGLAA